MTTFPRARTIRFNEVPTFGPGVGYYSVPSDGFSTRGPSTFVRARRWRENESHNLNLQHNCCRNCGFNATNLSTSIAATTRMNVLTTSTPAPGKPRFETSDGLPNFSGISHIAHLPATNYSLIDTPAKLNNCPSCSTYEKQLNDETMARRELEDLVKVLMHNQSIAESKLMHNQSVAADRKLSRDLETSLLALEMKNKSLQSVAAKLNRSLSESISHHDNHLQQTEEPAIPRTESFLPPANTSSAERRLTFVSKHCNDEVFEANRKIGNLYSGSESSSDESFPALEPEDDEAKLNINDIPAELHPEKTITNSKTTDICVEKLDSAAVDENCTKCTEKDNEIMILKLEMKKFREISVPSDTYIKLEKNYNQTKKFLDSLQNELDSNREGETSNLEDELENVKIDDDIKENMLILKEHFQSTVSQLSAVNKMAEDAKMTNSELHDEVSNLRQNEKLNILENKRLKDELNKLMSSCYDHLQENEKLQGELQEALVQASNLNESKIESLNEVLALKEEVVDLVEQHHKLQEANCKLSEDLQVSNEEKVKCLGEVKNCHDNMKELGDKLVEVEAHVRAKEAQIEELQLNIETLSTNLTELKNESEELRKEKCEMEKIIENQKSDISEDKNEIERLSEELRTCEQNVNTLKNREAYLISEMNCLDEKFQKSKEEFTLLEQSCLNLTAEVQQLTDSVTDLKFEKQEILEHNARLRSEIDYFTETVETYKSDLLEKEKDLKFSSDEVERLNSKVSKLTSSLESEKSINIALADKTDDAYSEIDHLTQKVDQLEKKCNELSQKDKDAENITESLQLKLKEFKDAVFAKEREIENMKVLMEEAKYQLERRDSLNGKTLMEVDMWKTRMSEAEEKVNCLVYPLEKENRILCEKIHELQQDLKYYEERVDYQDYKNHYEKLMDEFGVLKNDIDAKNEKLEQQREKIVCLESKLLSREVQLNAALSDYHKSMSQTNSIEKRNETIERELTIKFETIIHNLENEVCELKVGKSSIKDELEATKTELADVKLELDKKLLEVISIHREKEDILSQFEVKKKSNDEMLKKILQLIRGTTKLELKMEQRNLEESVHDVELKDVLSELDNSRDCLGQLEQYLHEQSMLIEDKDIEINNLTKKLSDTTSRLEAAFESNIENFEPRQDFERWASYDELLRQEKNEIEKKYLELKASMEPYKDLLESYALEERLLREKCCSTEHSYTDLADKYADLLGHQNQKQKIKHVAKLKSDNSKLRKENEELKGQLVKVKNELHSFVHNDIAKHGSFLSVPSVRRLPTSQSATEGLSDKCRNDLMSKSDNLISVTMSHPDYRHREESVLRENTDRNCLQ